jgi:hypothetical protein
MKKQIKKLQLNRETLTVLETDLKNAQGAAAPPTYLCTEWQSKCFCYT